MFLVCSVDGELPCQSSTLEALILANKKFHTFEFVSQVS